MRLVHKATGEEVRIGDLVIDFRGDKATVTATEEPRHAASSGRIYVVDAEGFRGNYYPSVFDCEWIEREDRPPARS